MLYLSKLKLIVTLDYARRQPFCLVRMMIMILMMLLRISFPLCCLEKLGILFSTTPTTSSVGGSLSANLPKDTLVLKLNKMEHELVALQGSGREVSGVCKR